MDAGAAAGAAVETAVDSADLKTTLHLLCWAIELTGVIAGLELDAIRLLHGTGRVAAYELRVAATSHLTCLLVDASIVQGGMHCSVLLVASSAAERP